MTGKPDLRAQPLPPGTRLLHIGPHKTGTTALQGALKQAREAMAEHGVVYPGRQRQHWRAALALTGRKSLKGDQPSSAQDWERLVEQVAEAGEQRVIISSEFFGEADAETARRMVDELGGELVQVLITLRPLSKIMPSAWQQYVRNGLRASYEEWLDGMLRKAPYRLPTRTFWDRHRHDELVERWAAIVGPQRVTVVFVDDSDRSLLMHTVEDLVELPRGILVPEKGWTNRSLTTGEVELIRQLNKVFKTHGWSDQRYGVFMHQGVTRGLQLNYRPDSDDLPIVTPQWALERAAEIGAAAAEKICTLGVRIIGDPTSLGTLQQATEHQFDPQPRLQIPAAVAAIESVIETSLARLPVPLGTVEPPPPATGTAKRVRDTTTAQLLREVGRRVRRRLRLARRPKDR